MPRSRRALSNSAALQAVKKLIAKIAATDATVLIQGESGTGKELAARAIHRLSSRSAKPFIAVNCASIPETLIESELFGHAKGAFTGALNRRAGKFEMADGGVIFLDEIGEMPLTAQPRLLRVLQERVVDRLGGGSTKVDIRVIAATNKNLHDLVTEGGFREDLYFRLNVMKVQMPALRDRPEDIPLLAQHFILKYGKGKVRGLTPGAESMLRHYGFPGNVRELENIIERAVGLGVTSEVLPEDLPSELFDSDAPPSLGRLLYVKEREIVEKVMIEAAGDYKKAATILGTHPKTMHRLLGRLKLTHLLKPPKK